MPRNVLVWDDNPLATAVTARLDIAAHISLAPANRGINRALQTPTAIR